jgi:putative addiction module killer protein
MDVVPKDVDYYYAPDEGCPYKEWFASLKEVKVQQAVDARLARARRGLLGDSKWVGQGVWEFRLDIGPGYRLYFGQPTREQIVLLLGGHKKTQEKDIRSAQNYWAEHQGRSK